MKKQKELIALYQNAIIVRLISRRIQLGKRVADIVFDNGEKATVPDTDIKVLFDLEGERE